MDNYASNEEIRNRINIFINTGKSLFSETEKIIKAIEGAKYAPQAIVDIFEFITESKVKKKRLWTNLGKIWASNPHYKRFESLNYGYQTWFEQITNYIRTISIVKRTLTRQGNSEQLLKRFNRPRSLKSLDKKIKYTIIALESIKEMKLIYNRDIPGVITKRKKPRAPKKISKYHSQSRQTLSQLNGYPEVKEALKGAIDRLEKKGPDYSRQCLGSCRNALESLVKQISGEMEWQNGLPKIVIDRTNRDVVKRTYSYLCKYGTHSQRITSQNKTEIGFALTLTAIAIILNK